jgi:hypothetical protein
MAAAKRPMIPIVKDGATATFRRTVGGHLNPGGADQRTRGECWGATSTDGCWRFDRLDDVGTPWLLTYQPEQGDRLHVYDYFRTLTQARAWVHAHGDAWLAQQLQEAAS